MRGRPPKKGAAVHLKELFASHAGQFQETEIELYGKKEKIRYYCTDLLWGQKLYQELRFVLVEMNGIQNILASTSLVLDPLSIIRLYSYSFRILYEPEKLRQFNRKVKKVEKLSRSMRDLVQYTNTQS